jgi:NADH-quinone oxidoreductase subunit L
MLVAGMTAFYMFRIYFVTFWGKPRGHNAEHAHEAPPVMLIPLAVLACFSIVAGFVPMNEFISIGAAGHEGHGGIDFGIAIPATVVALLGICMAWLLYGRETGLAEGLIGKMGFIYTVIKKKFYFDEIYVFVTKKVIFRLVAAPIAWFDRHVVDGGVNLSGWCTRTLGYELSFLQTGQVQTYGFWFVSGAVSVLLFILLFLEI